MLSVNRTSVFVAIVGLIWCSSTLADVDSGPAVDNPTPEMKVYAVTGEVTDEEVDYTARREEKPTVWMFVPKDKWTRPVARLMRELDKNLRDANDDAYIVAVWLTDDQFTTQDYLPRAQQSLKLSNTALTYYQGKPEGPADWGINPDADVTVVVTAGGKVRATWGFVSANETVAEDVLEAVKKTGDGS